MGTTFSKCCQADDALHSLAPESRPISKPTPESREAADNATARNILAIMRKHNHEATNTDETSTQLNEANRKGIPPAPSIAMEPPIDSLASTDQVVDTPTLKRVESRSTPRKSDGAGIVVVNSPSQSPVHEDESNKPETPHTDAPLETNKESSLHAIAANVTSAVVAARDVVQNLVSIATEAIVTIPEPAAEKSEVVVEAAPELANTEPVADSAAPEPCCGCCSGDAEPVAESAPVVSEPSSDSATQDEAPVVSVSEGVEVVSAVGAEEAVVVATKQTVETKEESSSGQSVAEVVEQTTSEQPVEAGEQTVSDGAANPPTPEAVTDAQPSPTASQLPETSVSSPSDKSQPPLPISVEAKTETSSAAVVTPVNSTNTPKGPTKKGGGKKKKK